MQRETPVFAIAIIISVGVVIAMMAAVLIKLLLPFVMIAACVWAMSVCVKNAKQDG